MIFSIVAVVSALTVVRSDYDILATIVVAVVALALLFTVAWALRTAFRVRSTAATSCWFDKETITSRTPLSFTLAVKGVQINPFFLLIAAPRFAAGESPLGTQLFDGLDGANDLSTQTVSFPHRGEWQLNSVRFELRDILGLTVSRWSVAITGSLHVRPQESKVPDWPVIVSSMRSGEALEHIQERRGDLLDLKPYHPSDGARRIVWKMYAKTNELVSRQPERSVDPEGETIIYAAVTTTDDDAAYAAIRYARTLADQDCTVLFSCLGAAGAVHYEDVEAPLVDSAFRADSPSLAAEEIDLFLTSIERENLGLVISKLIIIVGIDSVPSLVQSDFASHWNRTLQGRQVVPHILLSVPPRPNRASSDRYLTEFFEICARQRWEVSY